MVASCRRHGWEPPEFSVADIMEVIERGRCAKTGVPFSLIKSHGAYHNPYAPSPDRIDPTRGYARDNVQWVLTWYNRAKGELGDSDMYLMCKLLIEHVERTTHVIGS